VSVVYDAGVLVAADRSDREVWADHRVRLELGVSPLTTAPVVAQVSRTGRQAQLRRFLRGCDIAPFASPEAHDVGALAGESASSDVVDVHLMIVAYQHGFGVVTGDDGDLRPIADALPSAVPIFLL
jgi:predicted nucleic acid-binding protein